METDRTPLSERLKRPRDQWALADVCGFLNEHELALCRLYAGLFAEEEVDGARLQTFGSAEDLAFPQGPGERATICR